MPAITVPGFILDQYGRPAVQSYGGALYKRTQDDDRLRPRPPNHFADYAQLFAPSRYRELVSECRALATRGLVSALLEQKANYVAASHFRPRFCGSDSDYGAEVMPTLLSALKICNIRGARFDWRESWRLSIPVRATDGRFFVLLTEWADSGWPALQFLEGHRVGVRDSSNGIVGADDAFTRIVAEDGSVRKVRGAYKGCLIINGTIYNEDGTEVAYRVLGKDAKGADDEDVSARDLIQVARPQRYSEATTPPDLARALMDFLAMDSAQTAQLDQQISDAKLTFVEKNEAGRQDPAAMLAGMTPSMGDGAPAEMLERATWRYIKTGKGGIDTVKTNRPSDQWMNFDARVAARAAASIGWRIEMLDPAALRGAATRAFQDQINTTIADEFSVIEPVASRVLGYIVAKLAKVGAIPQHEEWMCWQIAPPPWFEVDRNSARIDLEEVAAGRVAMSRLHQRDGSTTQEVYQDRINAYKLALDMQEENPDVPLEIILGDLGATIQRTGMNLAQEDAPAVDDGANQSDDAKGDDGETDDSKETT